jgi:hypothetical protein
MMIFNIIGLVMVLLALAVAFVLTRLFGSSDENHFIILTAVVAILCDVVYRWRHPAGHWFSPSRGGSLFFLPVWLFGLFAIGWSVTHILTGESPSNLMIWITVGVVALILLGIGIATAPPAEAPSSEATATYTPQRKDWECTRCGQTNPGYSRTCRRCHLEI